VSARIRAGSRFKRVLCYVLIDVRYFCVLPNVFAYPRLKTTALDNQLRGGSEALLEAELVPEPQSGWKNLVY
jgi:hypothetical protein